MENRIKKPPQNNRKLDVEAGPEHPGICVFQGPVSTEAEIEVCFCLFK